MKSLFKTIIFIMLIIVFSGCEDELKQTQNETTKKQTNTYKHFKVSDVIIDTNYKKSEFYVPVYSHIFYAQDRYLKLAITLSIRNTDLEKDLYVESIDYYNTEGKLVKQFIKQAHILEPMASVDYVVNLDDMSGGSGANFLINVASKNDITQPIVQAIMINNSGNSDLCFITQGVIIK